jgi:hypothetical protein
VLRLDLKAEVCYAAGNQAEPQPDDLEGAQPCASDSAAQPLRGDCLSPAAIGR